MLDTIPPLAKALIGRLLALRRDALETEERFRDEIGSVHSNFEDSARNLAHYVGVRRHDLRELQPDLSRLGLSSLGRLESHALATIDAVLAVLHRLAGQPWHGRPDTLEAFDAGIHSLEVHAADALGKTPNGRSVRIMVTMPSEAAEDPAIIHDLLDKGMNIMRVNCAHDGPAEWARMVQNLHAAQNALGKSCRIVFDLAGPKLRTGPIEPGPGVARWKPSRNDLGQVVVPAFVAFGHDPYHVEGQTMYIPIRGRLDREARKGDSIRLVDSRNCECVLTVVDLDDSASVCSCRQSGYVVRGTVLRLLREGKLICEDEVAHLPTIENAIYLSAGNELVITREEILGKEAKVEGDEVNQPAQIGCSLAEIFSEVKPGERIFFDDGKIGGVIREVDGSRIKVEITHAAKGTAKLRAEKGINLPDTNLSVAALTEKDRKDLKFAAAHGDLVALSFVRRPEDVADLIGELEKLAADNVGIVLKIESRSAVEAFPRVLLTAMRRPSLAVMVARGDLGVEIGFERMAEIQEELLWFCEAAHVPVIWATQVLESLAKRGVPSRAEVTDAAMASRAECVMLNKGPHVVHAVEFLNDVLARMKAHQTKKSALMRRLRVADLSVE